MIEFNIGQINVQSMNGKVELLSNYMIKNGLSIVCVSETWEKQNRRIRINGYNFYSKIRGDGYGGVGIVIKKCIGVREMSTPDFEILECIAVQTVNLDKNLILVSIYLKPESNRDERIKANRDLKKMFEWINNKINVILGGDWNAHSRMWGCVGNNARGNLLSELITESDLILLNDGRPTKVANLRGTANALDLTMASRGLAEQISWEVSEENLGSDHYMIEVRMQSNKIFMEKKELMNEKNWIKKMNESLEKKNLENCEELEREIERINHDCVKVVDMKEIKIKEWWNEEIKYWHERKRKALRDFNRVICRQNLINLKFCTAKIKKAIRRAKRKSWRNFLAKMNKNTTTKEVYQKFNRVQGKNYKCKNWVLEDQEKGEKFLEMVVGIENNLGEIRRTGNGGENEILDSEFRMEEFSQMLGKVKSTTPGVNRVTYKMVQGLSLEAKENLLKLLNKTWSSGVIPEKWHECRIVPINKRGRDVSDPLNYRGISMLNVLMKSLNGMFKERMERWIEEENHLPDTTCGFRRKHSASECVERLVWEINVEKKNV